MDPDSDSIWLRIQIGRPWVWIQIRQNDADPSISGSGSTKREEVRKKTPSAWSIVIIQPLLPLPQSQTTLTSRWLLIRSLTLSLLQKCRGIGIFVAKNNYFFIKIFRGREPIAQKPIWDLERQTKLVKHVCSLYFLLVSFQIFLGFEKGGLLKL
jgi:hypothetical protein